MTQLDRLEALAKEWTDTGITYEQLHLLGNALPDLIRVARTAKNLVDFFGRLPGEADHIDRLADAVAPLYREVAS